MDKNPKVPQEQGVVLWTKSDDHLRFLFRIPLLHKSAKVRITRIELPPPVW